MERPVAARSKPEHLICRTGWALLLTVACAFFAYRAFVDIRAHDYDLQHNWWSVLTWAVWALLAAGLISEVGCWRERLFFGVLFLQFLAGCVFSLWASAPFDVLRQARFSSLVLWGVATLLGLLSLAGRGKASEPGSPG